MFVGNRTNLILDILLIALMLKTDAINKMQHP